MTWTTTYPRYKKICGVRHTLLSNTINKEKKKMLQELIVTAFIVQCIILLIALQQIHKVDRDLQNFKTFTTKQIMKVLTPSSANTSVLETVVEEK